MTEEVIFPTKERMDKGDIKAYGKSSMNPNIEGLNYVENEESEKVVIKARTLPSYFYRMRFWWDNIGDDQFKACLLFSKCYRHAFIPHVPKSNTTALTVERSNSPDRERVHYYSTLFHALLDYLTREERELLVKVICYDKPPGDIMTGRKRYRKKRFIDVLDKLDAAFQKLDVYGSS